MNVGVVSVLGILYFIAAKLGLLFAAISPNATPVWPPSGIALAACLVLGYRVWPAIFVGAFLANITTAGSIATSLSIAAGNALEALIGAYLVTRWAAGRFIFDRARDLFGFVAFAALVSTTVSATIGVTSLSLGGYVPWDSYGPIWLTWWLGDATGDLIVAPLLVLWMRDRSFVWSRGQLFEAVLLFCAIVAAGMAIFASATPLGYFPFAFFSIPLVLWAAFRFGPRETAVAIVVVSALAVFGTLRSLASLPDAARNGALLVLQAFMATIAVTGLAIAILVWDRKRAQQAQARLAAIVDSSDDAIISNTPDGVVTSWNPAAEHLFGWTAAEAVGRHITLIIPDDRRAEHDEALARIHRGEVVDQYETVCVAKDGRQLDVALTPSPVKDDTGRIAGVSMLARDVIERKRAAAERAALLAAERRAQEQLRTVVESMSAPVTRCSRDLRYLWVSKPYAEWLGRKAEDVVGRPIVDVIGAEAFSAIRPHIDRVLAGERVEYEERISFRGPGLRWIHAVYTPTRDTEGTPDGWVAVVIDIDRQRQTEEALAAARDELARQVDNLTRLSEMTARLLPSADVHQRLIEVLDLAIDFTGADMGNIQLLDQTSDTLQIVAQRGFEDEFLEFFARVDHGQAACGTAFTMRKRVIVDDVASDPIFKGTAAYEVMLRAGALSVQSTPLVGRSGQVLGMISTHFRHPGGPRERDAYLVDLLAHQTADFLERERTTKEREQLLAETEAARREAEHSTRARDEFLAMLGHELRNPLGAITSALAVLRAVGKNDAAPAARALDVMDRQLSHLSRYMDDLLDAGRVIGGNAMLVTGPVDLGKEAELAAATIATTEPGRRLITACDSVWVEADPTRLAQIITNLLSNALKFTQADETIELRVTAEEGTAVLTVTDSGAGIPPELLPRIFDLFVQGVAPIDRSQGGLGIGLTLVRKLVELHGGSVSATSDGAGRGSRFIVRLPRIEAPVTAPSPTRSDQAPRQSHRILVIEDNDDSRAMIATYLRLAGHQVYEAADGPRGIDEARAHRPELAVIDVGLPGADGYAVARTIRDLEPTTKLIALTGYGQPEDRQRAREAGFDTHITKPIDPPRLLELIDEFALQRKVGHNPVPLDDHESPQGGVPETSVHHRLAGGR